MGEYLNMLEEELKKLREKKIKGGLIEEIAERMRKYWTPLPEVDVGEYNITGVDSSYQSINLANGYTFLAVRACAVGKDKRRKLEVYSTTGEIAELAGRVMENLEHELLKESLSDVNLVDGSLYGRANHLPREFRNEGFEDFILRYYRNYTDLITEVRKRGGIIIGISKHTSTTFLRDLVVKEMYEEELKKFGIQDKDAWNLPIKALDNKREARREAKRLLRERGYERAYSLIMELTRRRPDLSIISSFGPGISKPILLGANARARRRYNELLSKGKGALQKIFPDVEINDDHLNTVLEYLNLPAFVSFYISFSPTFVMRVDFPAFVVDVNRRMQDVTWPEVVEVDMCKIIKIIKNEYADNYVHSVHLFAADKDVKLERDVFMNAYLPLVEKYLHSTPSIGDMRFLYRR